MNSGKIGLLLFYLELYGEVCAKEITLESAAFGEVIKREYEERGVKVVMSPVCRTTAEFRAAVSSFETENVDAIVTLHLAYSPSLESIDVISRTKLPLIILDTTPDYEFGFEQKAERIMFNHGIHGVQDFCNMLIQRGKKFFLEVGHWKESDVINRTTEVLKGCVAAKAMRNARVGIIGVPFQGMGDFIVPFAKLKTNIGMEAITSSSKKIAELMPGLNSQKVSEEMKKDLKDFRKGDFSEDSLVLSENASLGVRCWIEQERLSAWTVNFQDIDGTPGLPVVPFLEASKSMSRGIGYAGEGDVLTAALCGALMTVCPETTFTEMFCPDWKNNRIFMSHMGEINSALTAQKPTLEQRPYPYSSAEEPVIVSGCFKPGPALLLNLAPGPNDVFTLIATVVEVCDTLGNEKIADGIRGWIKTDLPVADFLEKYSLMGGTHHLVLSYGMSLIVAETLAATMQWKFETIE